MESADGKDRVCRSEARCFSPNSHIAQSYPQPRQRKGKVKWRVSAFRLKEGQMVNTVKVGQGPSHRRRRKAEGREHSCPSQAPGRAGDSPLPTLGSPIP